MTSQVTKLVRVCLLEPWLLLLWHLGWGQPTASTSTGTAGPKIGTASNPATIGNTGGNAANAKAPQSRFPWFCLGFMAVTTLNSVVGFSPAVKVSGRTPTTSPSPPHLVWVWWETLGDNSLRPLCAVPRLPLTGALWWTQATCGALSGRLLATATAALGLDANIAKILGKFLRCVPFSDFVSLITTTASGGGGGSIDGRPVVCLQQSLAGVEAFYLK